LLILMIRHHACKIRDSIHTGYLWRTGDAAPEGRGA
jgi:hypothetical protein